MEAIFGFHGVLRVGNNGLEQLGENPTEAQIVAFNENDQKDWKALYLIHRWCDESNFDRVIGIWDTLDKYYNGVEPIKMEKLQSLRKQYENLNMQEGEIIVDFFGRLKKITNAKSLNGEYSMTKLFSKRFLGL